MHQSPRIVLAYFVWAQLDTLHVRTPHWVYIPSGGEESGLKLAVDERASTIAVILPARTYLLACYAKQQL
jgi:hypothetical protein